ncbi:myelin and lymphocyte protein-like isoform X4 [Pangasianodon hypophthalmus]|uniref:myelin and lymphocyte protein-like isoform X4 n=1 Tax=Pangasianodon hypophthalmus TaxID=310915 RepID=UPI002307C524|nr:myelin and lymphocyte protein-like isoform X4 [Pangasianodon hypophthalmus]
MASVGMLPSGLAICCSLPDILFLPELAYVMAVSLFCFIGTFIWMMMFLCGAHHNRSSWTTADMVYHSTAALLYLSASVLLAYVTVVISPFNQVDFTPYKLNVSAVVFSFWATLQYIVHAAFSAIRWKSY